MHRERFIAKQDFAARLADPCHFEQRGVDIAKQVYPAEMIDGVEIIVAIGQIERVGDGEKDLLMLRMLDRMTAAAPVEILAMNRAGQPDIFGADLDLLAEAHAGDQHLVAGLQTKAADHVMAERLFGGVEGREQPLQEIAVNLDGNGNIGVVNLLVEVIVRAAFALGAEIQIILPRAERLRLRLLAEARKINRCQECLSVELVRHHFGTLLSIYCFYPRKQETRYGHSSARSTKTS